MGVAVTVEMFKPCNIMSLIDHKTSKTVRAVIAFRSKALYHNQAVLLYGLIIDKKPTYCYYTTLLLITLITNPTIMKMIQFNCYGIRDSQLVI